jgi:ABC-2 type transport system ATP-binding protein
MNAREQSQVSAIMKLMATQTLPIDIRNFQMRFGDKTVIEDLSFNVHHGETFGFLGSNGSGKTTTLRALLGIYEPTRGQLLVNGERYTTKMGGRLGYLPEERGLYQKETVLSCMAYFGRIKGMSTSSVIKWSMNYLERVGLAEKARLRMDKLSGGEQQKIQLGVTIMNEPELLILDEPTKSFDPVNRRLLMDILEELSGHGTTTVLVTHQMEEVERLCDRVVLLKDGKRRLYGTVDEVRDQFGSKYISVRFEGKVPEQPALYKVTEKQGQTAHLEMRDGVTTRQIFDSLAARKDLSVTKFEVQQASLDDIFIAIYSEKDGTANA